MNNILRVIILFLLLGCASTPIKNQYIEEDKEKRVPPTQVIVTKPSKIHPWVNAPDIDFNSGVLHGPVEFESNEVFEKLEQALDIDENMYVAIYVLITPSITKFMNYLRNNLRINISIDEQTSEYIIYKARYKGEKIFIFNLFDDEPKYINDHKVYGISFWVK